MADLNELLNEKAVYWPPAKSNMAGQNAYGTAVEIAVYWEDMQEERWSGNNVWMSKAQVITTVRLKELGVLWYGLLSAANSGNPFANVGATEIRQVERIPSVEADEILYTAFL